MPAPRRGSSAGRAATLTMRPPCLPASMALTAARQHRKHDTRLPFELRHQRRLVGLRHLARGKAAGDVDRRPRRHAGKDLGHHGLVGKVGDRDQLGLVAVGKALRLGLVHVRHDAGGARIRVSSADHRRAQRAGAAGHHDGAPGKIHQPLPRFTRIGSTWYSIQLATSLTRNFLSSTFWLMP